MTQSELYDWLLSVGILEPACVMLGTRCVAGRWIDMSEHLGNGCICHVGRVGISVIGDGDSWDAAHKAAKAWLSR